MANAIDIISKNSSSNSEISLIGEKEVTKDFPSLFDSLLKDSMGMEKEEQAILKQDSLVKKEVTSKEMLILEQTNNIVIENTENTDLKNSNNSLLDRLVLEAKNETAKEQLFNKISNDTSKNIENIKVEALVLTPIETSAQDKENVKIDLEKVVLDESGKTNQNIKLEIVDESIIKDSQIDGSKVEVQIEASAQDKENVKIDLEKVVLDESGKTNQNIKLEIVDESIIKDLQKDTLIIKPNDNKEIPNQNSLEDVESQIISNILNTEIETEKPKLNIVEETLPLVTKELLVNQEERENTNSKKSLMDILIEKNIKNSTLNVLENENINKTEVGQSKDFLSNLYLGGQKNLLNSQFLLNKSEAVNILKNANSLSDIEKSAGILELGLQNIDVEQSVDLKNLELVKKQDINNLDKRNLLDSLLMEKNVRSEDVKHLITKSIEASNALLENTLNLAEDVDVSVNSPLSYNIQTRIIGAKQQMSTMMSDIARQMYENYKPPVTVFRINLSPLELGSIAILMKNDKNSNALTISMNASNGGTLEALVENQNVLRNSLNKTFDENTIFNLDFTSSNQNNQQSSNGQSNSNQQNRFEGQIDTQSVLQLKEENKDREDKILDYM